MEFNFVLGSLRRSVDFVRIVITKSETGLQRRHRPKADSKTTKTSQHKGPWNNPKAAR